MAVCKKGPVGVPIKADTKVAGTRQNFARDNFRMQSAAILINVASVGRAMSELSMRAGALEYFRSDRAGRAVGAVHNNVQALCTGNGSSQPAQVVRAQCWIARERRLCLAVMALCCVFFQQCKDF